MLNNKKNKNNWYTFIELIVVITIVVIITLAVFEPYNYYQNKAKLNLWAKEVSQALYDARNMAINWMSTSTWNSSIWIYFDNSDSKKNSVRLYSYPFDANTWSLSLATNMTLFKTIDLQPWIEINSVWWKNNWLFLFNSIDWKSEFYTLNWALKTPILGNEIQIDISFKKSTSPSLQRHLIYYTKTNIVDF
jgi:type II secretory pathway pseudopilin PulG